MRLMLGVGEKPELLVKVERGVPPGEFEFWVVNGAWHGTYINGYITIQHPWNPCSSLDKREILSDNQDRLRGDYDTVFYNFDNPDYVAPEYKVINIEDDDIPF
jgi:hypothetical protein